MGRCPDPARLVCLSQVIETANAPIFGIDANGLVNEWNRKAVEITGFSRDEVLGEHLVNKYIRDEFRASVQAVLDSALRGQSTVRRSHGPSTAGASSRTAASPS